MHAGQLGAEVDDADDCFRAAPAEKAPAGSASLSSSPCCTTPRTCAEAEKIVAAIGQASFFIVVFPNMIWHFVPESASNFLLFLCTRCPACAKFIPLMSLVYHYPSLSHVSQGACTYRRHRHSHTKSLKVISRARCCVCLASRPVSPAPSLRSSVAHHQKQGCFIDLAIPASPPWQL